jgi:hypothetical protein
MGKQTQHKAKKRHKELDRMRKAKEKMERRQGKKEKTAETGTDLSPTSVTEESNQ